MKQKLTQPERTRQYNNRWRPQYSLLLTDRKAREKIIKGIED